MIKIALVLAAFAVCDCSAGQVASLGEVVIPAAPPVLNVDAHEMYESAERVTYERVERSSQVASDCCCRRCRLGICCKDVCRPRLVCKTGPCGNSRLGIGWQKVSRPRLGFVR